jgi:hypothetical protein
MIRILVYSTIVVPIAILIVGIILFFYKPLHRKIIGKILVILGSVGLLCLLGLVLSLLSGAGYLMRAEAPSIFWMELLLFLGLIAVEVVTIIIGVLSFKKATFRETKMT